jgi:hypothetical protein
MNKHEWEDYYRRVALREERQREVDEATGFSDAPGRARSRLSTRELASPVQEPGSSRSVRRSR